MAKQAQIDAVRPVLTAVDKDVTAIEKAIDMAVSGADKATDVLESGLEKTADVVPEVLDKSVHVAAGVTKRGVQAFRNPKTLAITLTVGGMVIGAGLGVAGYFLLKKKLEKQYTEAMERELDEMREFYIRHYKHGEYATPADAVEKLLVDEAVEALDTYAGEDDGPAVPSRPVAATPTRPAQKIDYTKVVRDSEAAEEIREQVTTISQSETGTVERNVFVDGKALVPDDWDHEAEISTRIEGEPYVVSFEEVAENVDEFTQVSYTYYEGDEVLANEQDEMVHDTDALVGDSNLGRFGHGSRDPNIVYVRNEALQLDIEITRSTGEYGKEVMGLRHSDETPKGLRRARWGDHE